MDPFSLICGIAGLVGLAQVVVEKGFSYIGTASGARDDIRNLISEVAVYGHIPHLNRYLRLMSECRLSAVLSSLVPVVDALELAGGGTGLFAIHSARTGLLKNILTKKFAQVSLSIARLRTVRRFSSNCMTYCKKSTPPPRRMSQPSLQSRNVPCSAQSRNPSTTRGRLQHGL